VKRSTRSRLTQGSLYAVLLLLVLVVVLTADWAAIKENFFDPAVAKQLWPGIVTVGAKNTIVYTFIAFAGGLVLAFVLALMKLSPVAPYRWLATSYVEFFRGLPALLVIIMMALSVPLAFGWAPPGGLIGAGVIALVMVSAAYMAETLRAGIQAVPKGQVEAAKSLGMAECGRWSPSCCRRRCVS
jgi:polar amino acid transport system permease protein